MPAGTARIEHLVELGRYAEAQVALLAALASTPDDHRLHGLAARALIGVKRPREALVHANRMIALEPEDEWGHRLAAVILLDLEAPAEAARAARTAVRLAPLGWQTHQVLALAASRVDGREDEARDAADRAVALGPDEAAAHFSAGLVAQRRGDAVGARAAYQRTLAIVPDHAEALNNVTSLARHRRLSRAARGYAGSLRADPQGEVSRRNLDLLAMRFVRRLYFASLASVAAGALASAASHGRVSASTIVVAVLTVAVVAAYSLVELRDIPPGLRRFVAGRTVRDPFLAATVVLTLAMLVLALVTCLVPYGVGVALGLLPVLGVINLTLALIARARRPAR